MAPVIRKLAQEPGLDSIVCVTAQHRQMLDQVLQVFDIHPNYDLDIMRTNQTLAQLTADVLTRVETVVADVKPDWVLVQGDTTSAMAGALAAFYCHAKVGHIEAGLRTGNKFLPFPEEANRKLIDHLSDLHFAPTESSRTNLRDEGITGDSVVVTGNTAIDALQWAASLPCDLTSLRLAALLRPEVRLLLVTVHRRESFGPQIEDIFMALREIAERFLSSVHIVYPVHLNPSVQSPAYRLLSDQSNITLLPPLDYVQFVHLMKRADLVITDSGGIQEEAPALGKPVLVLRDVTERLEAVAAGTVKIVGTRAERIVAETARLLQDPEEYSRMARAVNPYGDGHAAERILKSLLEYETGSRAR